MPGFEVTEADQVIEAFHEDHASPALAVVIARNGKVLRSRFFGLANTADTNSLPGIDTLFRIASLSKCFAAAAILQLRDDGLLSLEAPLSEVMNRCALHPAWGRLSIHELLSMTGRLITDDQWADREIGGSDEDFSTIFLRRPHFLPHEPLPIFSYSNLSYMILGRIITAVSGTHASLFIAERLLRPLGMTRTTWNPSQDDATGWARGYVRRTVNWEVEPYSYVSGDGALFGNFWSTLSDLSKWTAFLSSTSYEYDSVLQSESRIAMQENFAPLGAESFTSGRKDAKEFMYSGYGYGLVTYLVNGRSFVGHSGGLPGYGSHFRWDRISGLTVIALANATYCPVWELGRDLMKACSTKESERPPADAAVGEVGGALIKVIEGWKSYADLTLFSSNVALDMGAEALERGMRETAEFLKEGTASIAIASKSPGEGTITFRHLAEKRTVDFLIAPLEPLSIQRIRFQTVTE